MCFRLDMLAPFFWVHELFHTDTVYQKCNKQKKNNSQLRDIFRVYNQLPKVAFPVCNGADQLPTQMNRSTSVEKNIKQIMMIPWLWGKQSPGIGNQVQIYMNALA